MNMQKKVQKGFTLIELMIVIAIVGILAAIALPAYQDYVIRSKMSEALAELAEAKTTVAEYVASNGDFPGNPDDFGVDQDPKPVGTTDYVVYQLTTTIQGTAPNAIVYVGAAVFDSTWEGGNGAAADVSYFSLSGSTRNGFEMIWDCVPGFLSETEVPAKYLPANCRG